MKRLALVAIAAAVALALAGCASNDGIASKTGTLNQNYVSGDGSTFYGTDSRDAPASFTSTTDTGTPVDSSQYLGKVLVLNFWYASCAPCRTEAPILNSINSEYTAKGVDFLGVNTRDKAGTSKQFATDFKVAYPSVVDADNGNVLLAFASSVPANATPTTLVIDKKGRVAARISGELDGPGLLSGYLDTVLAEAN